MDEIRCGAPDCDQPASFESIVEMANLTGGMMGGLFDRSQQYRCSSGHVTTIKDELAHLKAVLTGKSEERTSEQACPATP
jgi:hypothetical protein